MPPVARKHRWKFGLITSVIGLFAIAFIMLTGVRMLFPLEYRSDILKWSAVHDLDPEWVAAVIRNESRFRSHAVSRAGAIGLMQIMPETGSWIAQQLQLPYFSTSMLTDVSLNIEMGTWYLRHLLDRFTSPDVALMAYNAGPTNARRWEGNLELAFPETQQFIRRIHLSLPVYRAYFAIPWLIDLIPSLHF